MSPSIASQLLRRCLAWGSVSTLAVRLGITVQAQSYELVSASVQSAPLAVTGGAYAMTAQLAPPDSFKNSSGSYTLDAVSADLVVIRSLTLPSLTVRLAGDGGVSIAWVDPTERYTLQSTPSLGPDGSWLGVTSLAHSGDTVIATVQPVFGRGNRFFRLVGR